MRSNFFVVQGALSIEEGAYIWYVTDENAKSNAVIRKKDKREGMRSNFFVVQGAPNIEEGTYIWYVTDEYVRSNAVIRKKDKHWLAPDFLRRCKHKRAKAKARTNRT